MAIALNEDFQIHQVAVAALVWTHLGDGAGGVWFHGVSTRMGKANAPG
jgi:hypothetical protein